MKKIATVKEWNKLEEDAKKVFYVIYGLCDLAKNGLIPDVPFKLNISKKVQAIVDEMELSYDEIASIIDGITRTDFLPWADGIDSFANMVNFGKMINTKH